MTKQMIATGNGKIVTVSATVDCPSCGTPLAFCTCGMVKRTPKKRAYLRRTWKRWSGKPNASALVGDYVRMWGVKPVKLDAATLEADRWYNAARRGLQQPLSDLEMQHRHAAEMAEYDDLQTTYDDMTRGGYG